MAARINATGSDRPSIKDLRAEHLAEYILTITADKWDDLGDQLLVRPDQTNVMNIIRGDRPGDFIGCCKRVLKEWLDTTEDATWNQLISALRSPSVRPHHFAGQLEHMLTAESKSTSIQKLEFQLADMADQIKNVLIKNKVNIVVLIQKLCSISVTIIKNIPLLDKDFFEEVKSINDFWNKLRGFWTIFDYDLLECVVEVSHCEEAQQILRDFALRIDPSAIEDADLVLQCKEKDWEGSPIPVLSIKLNTEKCTSDVKISVEKIMSKKFNLERFKICFKGIKKGCVELVYCISKSLKLYLLNFEVSGKDMAEFLAHDIVSLYIDDEFELKIPPKIDEVTSKTFIRWSAVHEKEGANTKYTCEKLTSIQDIEILFSKMTIKIKEPLIKNKVDVVTLIEQLCAISAVNNKMVPIFDDDTFKKIKSIDDLWRVLERYWSIYDYELLNMVVRISNCIEAEHILNESLSRINPTAIKDADLVLHCKVEYHEGLLKPMLRVKINAEKCTLDVKKSTEKILSNIYELDKYALHFKGIKKGYIELVYCISKPLKLYLLDFEITGRNMAELHAHDVISLHIDDEFELKVPPTIDSIINETFTWSICLKKDTIIDTKITGKDMKREMKMIFDSYGFKKFTDGSQKSTSNFYNHVVSRKPLIKSCCDPDCISDGSEGATEEMIYSGMSQSNNSTTRNCELEEYKNLKHQIDPSDDKCQLTLHVDQLKKKNYNKIFNNEKHKNESVSTAGIKVAQRSAKILTLHESVRVVSDPAKGRKLNYEELEDRMKTFKLMPQWDGPVEYQIMAEAGFVYTGQEDLVFCFNCNIKLDKWSKDMEPLLRHKEESPTCSFMRQKLQAVKGERGKRKSVVAPSKPLNSRLTSSLGQLKSSSLVTSKSIHTVVTGLNEPRLSYGGSFDDRPGASLPITPENYQSEEERIKSFAGWPLNEAVHPEQLAHVGFVYTGDGALVQCFQCGVKYRHWYKGDVPLSVHQKCNPRCSFLHTLSSNSKSPPLEQKKEQKPTKSYIQPESLPNGSNTQSEEVSKHSLQFPDYSKQAIRFQSFKHWRGVLPAHELAEAGFYMIAHRDIVRCHSCNVVVQEWEKSDNVIDEHHRLSPHCCFLQKFFSSSNANEVVPSTQNIDRISLQNRESSEITKGRESQQLKLDALNIKYPPLSSESKGSSKAPHNDDNKDRIPGIHYPPSWWSNPPRRLSEDSDESLYSPQSQNKNDYNMLRSLNPPKKNIQYEETLSEGLENNISIKTSDTRGDDAASVGGRLCQICYDKKIDCIFLPCGHARTCEGCATIIKNSGQPCPYCRKGVSAIHHMYL